MWKKLKFVILLWPLAVAFYLLGSNYIQRQSVDEVLGNADGVVWGQGQLQAVVRVTQFTRGESDTYSVVVTRGSDQLFADQGFVVDRDMFGGGFVKAIQADSDSELEIIVWGWHEEASSYWLDYSKGVVTQNSFSGAPDQITAAAQNWYQAYIATGLKTAVFAMFCFFYYITLGIIALIVNLVRKFRQKRLMS